MTVQLELLDRDWIESRTALVLSQMAGRVFTTDDLHQALGEPPQRNWWGVMLARLKGLGLVERVGYQPSSRPESNGRVVAVWKLKNTP